jgi:hypothetical protein
MVYGEYFIVVDFRLCALITAGWWIPRNPVWDLLYRTLYFLVFLYSLEQYCGEYLRTSLSRSVCSLLKPVISSLPSRMVQNPSVTSTVSNYSSYVWKDGYYRNFVFRMCTKIALILIGVCLCVVLWHINIRNYVSWNEIRGWFPVWHATLNDILLTAEII